MLSNTIVRATRVTPPTILPTSSFPQHLPSLPILLAHRPAAPDVRIKSQALRRPHRRNRQQVPDIHRLHMRRHHINLLRRIPLLAPPPRRMHRLHFISPPVQSPPSPPPAALAPPSHHSPPPYPASSPAPASHAPAALHTPAGTISPSPSPAPGISDRLPPPTPPSPNARSFPASRA